MQMANKLAELIRACFTGIWIESHEHDDALDEITGTDKKKMKCLSCGFQFTGEIYDRCPEGFSSDSKEVIDENDIGHRSKAAEVELGLPNDIS